jgi:hypothetical protein
MAKKLAITATSTLDEAEFNLRVPPELYRWLTEYARQQGRSTNAQIVQLIKAERARQALHEKTDVPPSPPADDDQV